MTSLKFYKDDLELRQQRMESLTVYPRSSRDDENGGEIHFVIENKARAFLSRDTRIVLPCKCVDPAYQFPDNVGVFALVQTATLSVGGEILVQTDQVGELVANMKYTVPAKKKQNVDAILSGVGYTFETASGGYLDDSKYNMDKLPGQYRMHADSYEEKTPTSRVKGNFNARACMYSGNNKLRLHTTADKSPEWSVSLHELFPKFFSAYDALPVGLFADEILLDITLTQNSGWGHNDRAVYCPELASKEGSSIIQVGIVQMGEAPGGTTQKNYLLTQTSTTSTNGSGLKLLCDLNNGAVSYTHLTLPTKRIV